MDKIATASYLDGERRHNGRNAKRRRMRLFNDQDALDLRLKRLEEQVLTHPFLESDQVNVPSSAFSHWGTGFDYSSQNVERPTNSSTTRLFTPPEHYSTGFNRDLVFDEHSRGRTPQKVEHTHHSPGTRPVSRAGSASSARSMIDERLEWAHQDRMRSASRDRSVPRSPFHENSPFYAEFVAYAGHVSRANDDKSFGINAAELPHGHIAHPLECSRINPSTGKPCNTIFARDYDLKRHEYDIHDNRNTRLLCPHCHEEKSFQREDVLTRHLRIAHPERSTHHYSCAALANLEDVTCHVHHGSKTCAYCGMESPDDPLDGEWLSRHLIHVHKFRRCETENKFYRPDDFRRHLVESHATSSSGGWTDILCNRSIGNKEAATGCAYTPFTPLPRTAGLEELVSQCSDLSKGAHEDVTQALYTWECCPEEPKTFDSKEDLRYAVAFTLVQIFVGILANWS